MIDEIIEIHAIVDDLLKAIGHREDCRTIMSDAEVITSALVAAKLIHSPESRGYIASKKRYFYLAVKEVNQLQEFSMSIF